MTISASIVIFESDLELLKKAVQSFLDSTTDSLLYLIDNSSRDNTSKHFIHPRIVFIYNGRNIGFGAAHNIALQEAISKLDSDYHIVLNPDVYFDRDVIDKMFTFMESNRSVGLAMPKVLYPDGKLQPLCRMLPTPLTLIKRRLYTIRKNALQQLNHWYEMQFSGYDKVMDVPFLSGCFMFLRTEALKTVGLFDENIFLYTEDLDLTRRIHQRFRTCFFPDVSIYHYHQRRSSRNLKAFFHHTRSAITYFNKWGWFDDRERETLNEKTEHRVAQLNASHY